MDGARAGTRRAIGHPAIDAPRGRRQDAHVNLLRDTLDGWRLSARWPVPRRRRYRLGLLLYAVGLRRVAVRMTGVRTGSGRGR